MSQSPIWKQTAAEKAAAFESVFAEIVPADRAIPSTQSQLRSVQKWIIKKRGEGYNLEQIAAGLKHPRIGIDVTASYVGKMLKQIARKREKRRKTRLAALIAATTKVTPIPLAAKAPAVNASGTTKA